VLDPDLAARKLYETVSADSDHVTWLNLRPGAKENYRRAAMLIAASTPAPLVIHCTSVVIAPYAVDIHKHIYADVTNESIEEAVEEFRKFLKEEAESWKARYSLLQPKEKA
jgi:hypothetical protein